MMIIPGIFMSKRVIAKGAPKEASSKRNIGILVVDQAPMKIRILLNLAPFFIKTAATGKAPYRGPLAAEPRKKASKIPLTPESGPRCFTMVSFGIQTSSRPSSMKMGGITSSISLNE